MAAKKAKRRVRIGDRISIPVSQMEFVVGGNTIWIQSPKGATVLRIKVGNFARLPMFTAKKSEASPPQITVRECDSNPVSHADIELVGNIEICLSDDYEIDPC